MRFFVVINSKKIFKYVVLSLSFTVLISQICLTGNFFRSYLTNVEKLEGTVAVNSEYVAPVGYVTLVLNESKPDENIKILVNGDEYCVFDEKIKTIQIKTQSVIEIINNTKNNVAVSLDNISDNLTATLNNSNTDIENISVIARVVFR